MKKPGFRLFLGIFLFILTRIFIFSATVPNVITSSNSNFYENGGVIVYTVRVENTTSNALNNYKVENLLFDTGNFSSVAITSDTSSSDSNFGVFSNTNNLVATGVNIPVDGFVQYKLTATLKPSTVTPVIVKTSLYDENNIALNSSSNTVNPVVYNYTVTKTASSPTYSYNGNIIYTITVTNNHSTMPLSNISVTDILSTIQATSVLGTSAPAFNMSGVSITATGTNGSNTGIFVSTGDLNATNVTVAPSSNVKYVITAKVNTNIVGAISNQVAVIDNSGATTNSSILTVSQIQPVTTISKTLVSPTTYSPGGTIQYIIAVKNTGSGIAYNRTVSDLLGNININLSSDLQIANNASDTLGNPFSSVSISAALASGSTKSSSTLLTSGGITTNPNLADSNVILYPGETINYTVTAITKNSAISNIPNSASLINNNNSTSITSSVVTTTANTVLDSTSTAIKRVKTTNVSEYKPGDLVEYTIVVSNTDATKFANNVNIVDIISNITAKTYLGTTVPAFENWVLTVVNSSGAGTKPGNFNYGSTISSDINIVADLAPGGSVTYKLVAKIKDSITGLILDSTSSGLDNVKETGTGIKMSEAKLSVEKNVNTTEYISGSELIYKINISNDGDGIGTNISVVDLLSSIQTDLITGGTGAAYSSWKITAAVLDSNGSVVSNPNITTTGISGTTTTNLNTVVVIAPSESIEYTVTAIVNPLAKGKIINKASVNSNLYSDKGATTKVSQISINKSSDMGAYPISGKNKITYSITVSNNANNGVALNVPVVDNISSVQAELLEPLGSMVNAFSSWTIQATTSGIGTTSGTFADNQNLNTSVNIAPGGNVTYTIVATLNSSSSQILYGSFSNTASSGPLSDFALTVPKKPNLAITKIAREQNYESEHGTVTYEILVKNNGEGYANDAIITDSLSSVTSKNGKKLSSWTITSQTSGVGTTAGVFSNNNDINTKVDIAPGGYVKYIVSASIQKAATGEIINTAKVFDAQSGNNYTASASISEKLNYTLFISKSSATMEYSPGKPFSYYIDVINNSSSAATNVTVVDKISDIKGTLANNGGTSPTDLLNQSIFESWNIYRDGVLLSSNTDLNNLITKLESEHSIRYEIVGIVKANAVEPKIENTATLFDSSGKALGNSYIENNIINLGGYINRSVDKTNYNPGVDTITYTITVGSGSNGYYNNVNISELISNISVDLIDGTQGNPFLNPETGILNFSVTQDSSSFINSGTTTIPVANNTNITGIVDIKTGDKIVYKVTGTVRKDATGIINFNSLTTSPYKPNISLKKRVIQKYYTPGEKISYVLSITNNSQGNAKDYHILDDLKSITVLDSDGNTVPAFTSFSFFTTSSAGYKADLGTYSNNNNLDTLVDIPANGGRISYVIDAIVTPKALGSIVNLLEVEDDYVSSIIMSGIDKPFLDKKITKLYDINGTAFPSSYTQYIPGGYIEYDIIMKNLGYGILANNQFIDNISSVQTAYYDGTTGPAFDSWTITLKERDSLASTNIGTVSDSTNINTNIDIAPSGYITYTVKAKINEKSVGDITNNVSLGDTTANITISSLPPLVSHTKVVKNTSGSVISSFTPGQTVVYTVTLSNTGEGISYNNKIVDTISSLLASVAENGTNGTSPTEHPFSSWDIAVTKTPENTTKLDGNYSGGTNLIGTAGDINLSSVSIAPRGSVTFTITARIKDNVFGNFTNTSKYTDKAGTVDTKTAALTSATSTITRSKVISKLNGVPFTGGMTYKPGDSIEYLITINNTGLGFSNNLNISDDLDAVTSTLNTGAIGPSLENINITTVKTDSRTYLRTPPASNARIISSSSDISPNGKITFTIDGNIKTTSTGTIAGNKVIVGGNNTTTPVINPKPPVITATKELISPTTNIYKPNDIVNYKLTVKNTGEGYGVNIPIKDEISKIMTTVIGGGQGTAFSSWTITKALTEGNGITTNTDVSGSNTDINITTANIAPGATIVYDIKATVNPKAVGSITNIAYINSIATPSPTINLKDATLTILKTSKNTDYTPGGEVVFYVDITNTSDTTAANVLLTDATKDILTDLSSNVSGVALASNFTYTTNITGDSTNTFVGTLSNGANLSNTRLDIAPNTTIRVAITGTSVSNAMGTITNNAVISYKNVVSNSSVTVNPVLASIGNIKISKEISQTVYAPGTPVQYTLKIKNEGTGYATGVEITDHIKNIVTTSINGGSIPAFDSYSVVSSKVSSPNSKITLVPINSGYDSFLNIAPGDTITIVIEGVTSYLATGPIDNIVDASYASSHTTAHVEVTPLPSVLDIKKSVDKLIYDSEDTLTYTIQITNLGQGPAIDVNIKDQISKIDSTFVGGQTNFVFDPSTIVIKRKIGTLPETTLTGIDLDDTLNIPSAFKPGENKVIYTITAKIKPLVNGKIKNSALLNNIPSNEVVSEPNIATINFIKSVSNPTYEPGKLIKYAITLENIEDSPATGISLVDNIKDILAVSSNGNSIPAFKNWRIVSITDSSSGSSVLAQIKPAVNAVSTTENILVTGDIAPLATITIQIEATVNDNIVGTIDNTATFTYDSNSNNSKVTSTSENANLILEKKVLSVNDTSYTPGSTYIPGGTVEYEVKLSNTGLGFARNISVNDYVTNIVSETSNGNIAQAFTSWTYTVINSNPALSVIHSAPADNTNLNSLVTLAPDSYIIFKIKGIVNERALGIINENIVTVLPTTVQNGAPSGLIAQSDVINPGIATLSINKEIVTGLEYIAGKDIEYKITIENTSNVFANNVTIKDAISTIQAESIGGSVVSAFESWTVTAVASSPSTSINGQLGSNLNIDSMLVIAPNSSVVYTIKGKTNANIVGDITNVAKGTYNQVTNNYSVTSVLQKVNSSDIKVTKTTPNSTYFPGSVVTFTILIENTSNNVINDFKIKDEISSILSSSVDGTQKPAFTNWTISSIVNGDSVNSDISSILTNGDIDSTIDIGKLSSVNITITGTTSNTSVGEIINTAYWSYGAVTNSEISANILPVNGDISITKTVNSPTYNIGDTIVYKLEISNNGTGFAKGVSLVDNISNILTDVSNSSTKDKAFKNWTIAKKIVPTNSSIENENLSDGYLATLNIYPGEVIEIEIATVLNDNILGKIANKAEITYNSITKNSSVNIDPKSVLITDISIEKTVDKIKYIPGDLLTYTIKVKNNSNNWANDINLQDSLNTIESSILGGGTTVGKAFLYDPSNELNQTFDLAPNTEVVYTLVGKVSNNLVSNIENSAKLYFNNSSSTSNTVITEPTIPDLIISKSVLEINYSSGKTATYKITLKNDSPNNMSQIHLKDFIRDIKVKNYKNEDVPAFKFWNTTFTSNNPLTKAYTLPLDNENIDTLIDIGANDELVFTVVGGINSEAVGTITNEAVAVYNSTTKNSSVSIDATKVLLSDITVTKTVNSDKYTPGDLLTYTVKVKNNSDNWAMDINLQDNLNNIESSILGGNGTLSKAFVFNTKNALNETFNLAPSAEIEYTVVGTVSSNLIGNIENTATISFDNNISSSNTVVSNPIVPDLNITKEVIESTYTPGKDVTYKITLKNDTLNNMSQINLKDSISNIKVKNYLNQDVSAFVSWKTTFSSSNPLSKVYSVPSDNKDIDTFVDIGANDELVFTVVAIVNPESIGTITNETVAVYNSTTKNSSVNIEANKVLLSDITVTKTVNSNKYAPGDLLTYTVKVKNNSNNWAMDINLQDNLNNIESLVLGGNGTIGKAFVFDTKNALNETFNLAPNAEIEYTVAGTVSSNLIGNIENTATISFDNNISSSNTVVSNPIVPDLNITKKVIESAYNPGKAVTYKITLKNDTLNNMSQINLKDSISNIKVKNYLNQDVSAFVSWKTTFSSSNPLTKVYSVPSDNKDIDTFIDLGANDELVFTVVAIVNPESIGTITNETIAVYNSTTKNSSVNIEANKVLLSDITVTKTVNSNKYAPGELLTYTFKVKNNSNNWAIDINLQDNLNNIESLVLGGNGTLGKAFVFDTKNALNETFSLAPNAEIEYTVAGTVSSNLIGNIENTATISFDNNISSSNTVISNPIVPDLNITKEVVESTYNPSKAVTYKITLKNDTLSNMSQINLKDSISSIKVKNYLNQDVSAFVSWKTTFSSSNPLTKVYSVPSDNKDIDTFIDIGASDELVFTVVAIVNPESIGTITNETVAVYNSTTKNSSVNIEAKKVLLSDIIVTKTVNSDKYAPNDLLTYTVKVKNNSDNWAMDINLQDNLNNIESLILGGNGILGKAFVFDTKNALNETFNLAPSAEIEYTIAGTVSSNLIGHIDNTATISFDNNISSSNTVISNPIVPDLNITKEVIESTYNPSKAVTYKITLKNDTLNNMSQINLKDSISNIKVKNYLNQDISAFVSWKTTFSSSNPLTKVYSVPSDNKDIDTFVDLGASDELVFTVVTIVNPEAVGTITNETVAVYNSTTKNSSVNIEAKKVLLSDITVTKTVNSNKYAPGDLLTYTIKVKNNSDNWAMDINLQDNLNNIESLVLGGNGILGKAFVFDTKNALNETFSLAPSAEIEYTVAGTVSSNLIGNIENTATTSFDNNISSSNTVVSEPIVPDLNITKEVIESTYNPGKAVTYKITLKNDTINNMSQINLKDSISNIKVKNYLNQDVSAFTSWKITYTSSNPLTKVYTVPSDSQDIDTFIDIGTSDELVFTVVAIVSADAIGTITNETFAVYNSNTKNSSVSIEALKVLSEDLVITKTVSSDIYTPGDLLTYTIKVKNISDSWAMDINLQDNLNDIESLVLDDNGTLGKAFVFDSKNALNETFSLAPSAEIEYTITGTVSSNLIGNIENTAITSFDNNISSSNTVVSKPIVLDLNITKEVIESTYNPGKAVTYKITLKNDTLSNMSQINLKDSISNIKVKNYLNQDVSAFTSWKITYTSSNPLTKVYTVPSDSQDIDTFIDLGASDELVFTVVAIVSTEAIGTITNETIAVYNSTTKNSSVNIEAIKVLSEDLVITKTVNSDIYTPGDLLTYTIKVKNISDSWAMDINLQDNLNDIESLVLGDNGTLGKAFIFDTKNALNETFSLAPSAEMEFTVTGTVSSDLIGVIENTAKISFGNNTSSSNTVVTEPVIPDLIFSKSVLESEYSPGKTITYEIALKNDSLNNMSQIHLKDFIKDIKVKNYKNEDVSAFISWKITFTSNNPLTKAYTRPIDNENIDTLIDLAANDELIFTIIGITNSEAKGDILNTTTAVIPQNDLSNITLTRNAGVTVKSYVLDLHMEQRETTYNPGEWIEYDIIVKDLSDSPALDIDFAHFVKNVTSDSIDGTSKNIFTEWKYEIVQNTGLITPITLSSDEDISNKLFLDGHAEILIRVKAKVNSELIGDIRLNSTLSDSSKSNNTYSSESNSVYSSNYVLFQPSKPNIVVNKTSEVLTNSLGIKDTIVYTVDITNIGKGNAIDVSFKDEISKIISENGDKAFDSWTVTYNEKGHKLNLNLPSMNNKDIEHSIKLENNNKNTLTYTITAILNKNAFGNISNTATVTDAFGITSNSTVKDEIKNSRGQLVLYKKAFQNTVKLGEAVEYEVIVKNENKVTFENIELIDRIPAGFKFLENSAIVTLFDTDGTAYKKFQTSPVLIGKNLHFNPITLDAGYSFSIRYLLKPSIGVAIGKYVNTAYATISGVAVSNTGEATVEVTADPLFDTASIIGKVFHDLNGDNYQNDPEATRIFVKINIDGNKFIPKSAEINENKTKRTLGDKDVLSTKGILIKKIKGIDSRLKNKDNMVVIKYKSYSREFTSLKLTTSEGTEIIINNKGEYTLKTSSSVKSGMNSQIVSLKQNIYADNSINGVYIHELIIENNAFYENGIPGVRVFNADGIIVETDAYGRYQIPDQWILNKKGQNIVIKVDEGTLPKGMKITSENPYVQRVSSNILNKFNFSVQEKNEKESD